MAETAATDSIRQQAIDGILKVTGDDGSTEMLRPSDQIAAARFAAAQAGVGGKRLGIRIMKVRNGNALGQ